MYSRRRRKWVPYILPVLGGMLLAGAFPPLGWYPLAWISLALFFISLRGTGKDTGSALPQGAFPTKTQRFLLGYAYGVSFSVFNFLWLGHFVSRWTGSSFLGLIPWALVVLAFSVYYGFLGLAVGKAWQRREEWSLPLLWAGCEVLRSVVPYLYFPWALLGTCLHSHPSLLQPAYWGGIFFLSFWVALGGLSLAVLGVERLRKRGMVYGGIFFAMGALSWFSVPSVVSPEVSSAKYVRVGAIQPGVDLAFGDPYETQEALWRNISKFLQEARKQGCEWVVLPEGLGVADVDSRAPFSAWGEKGPGISLILGAQRREVESYYQSAFAYNNSPPRWAYADKVRLVIFGEYVPFRKYLPFLSAFRLPSGDLSPGKKVETLEVGGARVGALLCFEALFEEVARAQARQGAKALAVLSLDDWYQGTGAVEMLKSASVLRAVENRLPVVRSAPLGVTMIVDPYGRVLASAPLGVPRLISASIPLKESPPLVLREIFPYGALAFFLVYLFFPFRRAREAPLFHSTRLRRGS